MKKFMRTSGGGGGGASAERRDLPPPPALNGHAGKSNGHANGGGGAAGDWVGHEDQHSTLSRYWTGSKVTGAGSEGGARLWEDPEWPVGARALGASIRHVQWMRPHELCTQPVFQEEENEGEESGEACHRWCVEGGGWLAVAAAALRLTPRLLARVVPAAQDFHRRYTGAFRFRFWQFGEWRELCVDDRLPVLRGRLLGVRHTAATHFWLPLLEKAYAKLYGSYATARRDGSVARALQDLTGGVVQSFSPPAQERLLTFQVLNSAVPRSSLLVATIHNDKEKQSVRLRNGLMSMQAYCVTGLARVRGAAGDTPLVRLRNPAGCGEWAGAWSRTSWEWHALSARDQELLSVRVTHHGEFWMCFSDFARCFSSLELVHVGPDDWMAEPALHGKRPWRAVLARRRWRAGYNAGGGPRHIETTAMNPQFHVQIPRACSTKCHVVVSVAQQHAARLKAIGFAVYEVPPHAPRLTPHLCADQRPLDVTNHSAAREVVTFFTLPPGDYVVVPQTSAPNQDAKFLLRILTDEQTNIWEVNEDNMVISNISTEFIEDNQPISMEDRITLTKLLGKRSVEELDAEGLRRALRRGGRGAAARASPELCRALVMLRDASLSGRMPVRDLPPLLRVLRQWTLTFAAGAGVHRCSRASTSSYRLRALLRAAGVTISNKVLECLVLRFASDSHLTAEAYIMAMARLHLAHERYHSFDTKMKTNPLSLEEMILMTIYS